MATAFDYYKQAEFSLAAYANLQLGTPSKDELKRDTTGMADSQAAKFAETYNVVAQYHE